jgi:hypothetical protein
MANPVVHFEVTGTDAATLRKFYGEAFDWQLQDVMEGAYFMVNTGGEGDVAGGIGASPAGPGQVTFYVQVDDLTAALEKINSLGGSTISEPMDVPGGPTIAHFADPEGHVIGLVKTA